MLGLPKATEFNKRIPKQKFYENMDVTPTLKRFFVDQIKLIYWRNKLATATMNIAAGEAVREIEVFEICLQKGRLDETVLRQIDKEIPYHILFLLTYNGKEQVWIGYKEADESGKNAFKVNRYYHTGWVPQGSLQFAIDGLDMDAVYAGLVYQVAGDALFSTQGETLQESVKRDKMKRKLEKQITVLEAKMHKEKQLNRRMEYNAELKKLRKELEKI